MAFALQNSELIIRSQFKDKIFQLIPPNALKDDFPWSFVHGFAHWLDLSSRIIEWRPLVSRWVPSSKNWRMQKDCKHAKFQLFHGGQKLIDIRSKTALMMHKVLSPIEEIKHIRMTSNNAAKALHIALPRLNLDFKVDCGSDIIQSKQYRSMMIDELQTFGAFSGLCNALVLRSSDPSISRCVIVPVGTMTYSSNGHHVNVRIDTSRKLSVKYHVYTIDERLGRLLDDGSLHSRLFKIYLHATTSHCLVDELTQRTGTEEALHELGSAGTRSLSSLGSFDAISLDLLQDIAALTPQRTFYPAGLQVMQIVTWNSLPSLSQSSFFYDHIAQLKSQALRFAIFHAGQPSLPRLPESNILLQDRAKIRESALRVDGFGAARVNPAHDTIYRARDRTIDVDREACVAQIAKLTYNWSSELQTCAQLLSQIESWQSPITQDCDLEIGYDSKCLQCPSDFFPKYWNFLRQKLTECKPVQDKFWIMAMLSTLSYARAADQELIHTLLAFATLPLLKRLEPPSQPVFTINDGYKPSMDVIYSLVAENVTRFDEPGDELPFGYTSEEQAAHLKRWETYEAIIAAEKFAFANGLLTQWPTATVVAPKTHPPSTHIHIHEAICLATPQFKSWFWNSKSQEDIDQVQKILTSFRKFQTRKTMELISEPTINYTPKPSFVDLKDMFSHDVPHLSTIEPPDFASWIVGEESQEKKVQKIEDLVSDMLNSSTNEHERNYAGDLSCSLKALKERRTHQSRLSKHVDILRSDIITHLQNAQCHQDASYALINAYLHRNINGVCVDAQMTPRISPSTILGLLAIKNDHLPQE